MYLNSEIALLEKYLQNGSKLNEKVSAATVDWHIHHSLLVLNGILGELQHSDPSTYRWKFSFTRLYIFVKGSFPRGKARAPKAVTPEMNISPLEMSELFDKLKKKVNRIEQLKKNNHFTHPFFGELNKKQSIYFLKLHTAHHIKIIEDILELDE